MSESSTSVPLEAPAIRGSYPGDGEIIGPLWQRIWAALREERYLSVREVQQAVNYPVFSTVRNLLQQARAVGLLHAVVMPRPGEALNTKRYAIKIEQEQPK